MALLMRAESPSTPAAPAATSPGVWRAFAQGAFLGIFGVAVGLWVTSSLEHAAATAAPAPEAAIVDEEDARAERQQALALARLDAVLYEPRRRARPAVPRGEEAEALQALGRKLGAQGAEITNPCVRTVGADCAERALEPFFQALDRAGDKTGQARIAVFGNSLIASDRIVNIWRDRMQDRFGDAGRGFLLTDRMAPYGGRSRTGVGVRGFETYNIAQGELGPWPHGLPGVLHFSRGRARARFLLDGAARARVFWLDHRSAPALRLRVDDGAPVEVAPERSGAGRVLALDVPAGAQALELEVTGGQAVIYGASIERATPGVIVDTLGVVASDSSIFLKEDEALFRQHLAAIAPDLVTVMLGGNEIKRVAWGKSDLATVRADLTTFLRRIRSTVPSAACLVVGPIENVQGEGKSHPWAPRWQLYAVNRLMKEVALAERCAHFDLFEAMGGKGALRRLDQRGLLHDDRVHPKGKGLDLPGELIADALLDAYEASEPLVDERELVARWRASVPPVEGGNLSAMSRHLLGSAEAPSHVAVLSASHEDDRLWAEIRRGLGVRFGLEGRGTLGLELGPGDELTAESPGDEVTIAVDRVRVQPGVPLPDLIEGRYRVVVASAGAADLAGRLAAVGGDAACLVVRGPHAPFATAAPPCALLDPIEATGGVAAWRARSLVDEAGALTEAGVAAAADIVLAALLDPIDRALDAAGRSG